MSDLADRTKGYTYEEFFPPYTPNFVRFHSTGVFLTSAYISLDSGRAYASATYGMATG